jgi:hypothetical protein
MTTEALFGDLAFFKLMIVKTTIIMTRNKIMKGAFRCNADCKRADQQKTGKLSYNRISSHLKDAK